MNGRICLRNSFISQILQKRLNKINVHTFSSFQKVLVESTFYTNALKARRKMNFQLTPNSQYLESYTVYPNSAQYYIIESHNNINSLFCFRGEEPETEEFADTALHRQLLMLGR